MHTGSMTTKHPSLTAGRVAVIVAAASALGLAAPRRIATVGMQVLLAGATEAARKTAAVARGGSAVVRGSNVAMSWTWVGGPEAGPVTTAMSPRTSVAVSVAHAVSSPDQM